MSTTDRSGVITLGGTAQVLMPASANRDYWRVQNGSHGELWWNDVGTAAIGQPGSYRLGPGSMYESPTGGSSAAGISITGATTALGFASLEITGPVPGVTIIDRSGILGTTPVLVFSANASRNGYRLMNLSHADIWYSETGTAVVNGSGSFRLSPGAFFESTPGPVTINAVSFVGTALSLSYSAGEW